MSKLTLTDITSGYALTTTVNANNALIEAALENTLSRNGASPNTMNAQLDMNSNRIVNLPDASNNSEPVTLGQAASIQSFTGVVATAGAVGAVLWPQTAAELAAGVTPTNYEYEPGHVLRYGDNTTPGTTDMSSALQAALDGNLIAYLPNEEIFTSTTTISLGEDEAIIGLGRDSRITYNGTGNAIDITGDYWRLEHFFLVLEQSNAVGIDVNNQSYGNAVGVRVNGRKTEGKTGQTGIVIDGDGTGGYWNKFDRCEVRNIATCYHLLNEANSNDFVSCINRAFGTGWLIDGVTGTGFHSVNNHIIGGSSDTFDSYAVHIQDADYNAVIGHYIESVTGGSRPWIVDVDTTASHATNNMFIGEFSNVALGPTDNGTNTIRIGASDARIAGPEGIFDTVTIQNGGPTITQGTGSPEAAVTEVKGSLFISTDANPNNGESLLYQKTTTGGNTGWRELAIARPGGTKTLSTGTATVDFTDDGFVDEPDTGYMIFLTGEANETFYASSRATTGFTINSSNASSNAVVHWYVVRRQ